MKIYQNLLAFGRLNCNTWLLVEFCNRFWQILFTYLFIVQIFQLMEMTVIVLLVRYFAFSIKFADKTTDLSRKFSKFITIK